LGIVGANEYSWVGITWNAKCIELAVQQIGNLDVGDLLDIALLLNAVVDDLVPSRAETRRVGVEDIAFGTSLNRHFEIVLEFRQSTVDVGLAVTQVREVPFTGALEGFVWVDVPAVTCCCCAAVIAVLAGYAVSLIFGACDGFTNLRSIADLGKSFNHY
jgi:hypothetical protein